MKDSKYEEALERAKQGLPIDEIFPELKESEDERTRKFIMACINELRKANAENAEFNGECSDAIAYLERQKEREPVDLSEMMVHKEPYIAPVPIPIVADEQKPAEGTALQKAFVNSKIDYTLEEKCDASDYADAILSTSVAYGENEEEYKLHKIIEAAFIAGQKKEQQPAEWSEEDENRFELLMAMCEDGQNESSPISTNYREMQETKDWLKNRFKFLRHQPHLKPSKKQMIALEWKINNTPVGAWQRKELELLYNDLKKL